MIKRNGILRIVLMFALLAMFSFNSISCSGVQDTIDQVCHETTKVCNLAQQLCLTYNVPEVCNISGSVCYYANKICDSIVSYNQSDGVYSVEYFEERLKILSETLETNLMVNKTLYKTDGSKQVQDLTMILNQLKDIDKKMSQK